MADIYDLVIVGGGSAGLTAAGFAVQLGARVAVVEKHRIGGDCTWTGCVPSKTLLKIAKVTHEMRIADRYGLTPIDPVVDLKSVMQVVQRVINQIYQYESPEALHANGIDTILGDVHFLDPHTLSVNENMITAHHILISTGAHPFIPPINGLDTVNYLTYENIWNLEMLPKHLLVIGAGPIGCEIAQAFRRLGSQVTLIEGEERMLFRDEQDASKVLTTVFKEEEINMQFGVTVERVWQKGKTIHAVAGAKELIGDCLLVAVGRQPNVEGLALEKAGVAYSQRGIVVNEHLRTSQRHIYAAGDCIGSYQFTHYAGWQAVMAVRNALLPGATKGIRDMVPWTTFTDPEVAHVGQTEKQAREQFGDAVLTCHWPMDRVDRAVTEGETSGFLKLVYKKDGSLLGATIVCQQAGEMIHEWIIALEHGLKVGKLAQTIHVYPTYSTASMQAAAEIRTAQLLGGKSGRVIRGLSHLLH